MKIYVFDQDMSAQELDEGKRMVFHPQYGRQAQLRDLLYDPTRFQFYLENTGAWSRGTRKYLDRIGDGKDYKSGDRYPAHWIYCPFSGEEI
ncbi:MAG: hypothetical protein Greene041662_634 [Candidatus Peregrinibacteria bacterium Greene0416_62]|nr:MAG: hypothetical protein Greene041662_634 [Candidatus Peregrinibacteria bacterium Greene0416_62]TSC97215.1 MAG: hypothetical protein Greene101449_1260 [Candidatus Peregrinibacteria bacterium Greene1014_49]